MKNNLRKINNNKKPRGGEGLVDIVEIGPFSETTSASFSVDMVFGAVDGVDAGDNKQSTFDYQFNIGLTTSFTGEDGLDIGIDLSGAVNWPSGHHC